MKKLIMLVLLMTSLNALADEVFYFGNLVVVLGKVDGITVNRGCVNRDCLAYKKYFEFKDQKVSAKDLVGGKNPKAVKCKTLMEGRVLIGQDKEKNQQSFCAFSDDSFLRLN